MNWLYIIISFIVGGLISFLLFRKKIKVTQKINEEIYQENNKLEQQNIQLEHKNQNLLNEETKLMNSNLQIQSEIKTLNIRKDSINEQIQNLSSNMSALERQSQEAADLFLSSKMEIAQKKLEEALQKETKLYNENIEDFKQEYHLIVESLMKEYKKLIDNVNSMKQINDAAVAAARRAEEMKEKENFYRIQLSENDKNEIKILRSIESQLRNKEPLNKVIWKCYYEKPTTDLTGRVIGQGIHIGIYKITEINTGKCYIGQSLNLSDRWKQHIKRGIGAEAPTKNKLYPAMNAIGPENFTFEVIEECDKSLLDEREKYWQNHFQAKEFGYSIK